MTSLYIVYIYTNCILWTLSDNEGLFIEVNIEVEYPELPDHDEIE